MRRLPLALQTAYADLLDQAREDHLRTLGASEGGFVKKTVKGRTYWYLQKTKEDGKQVQTYLGRETPELLEQIARSSELRDQDKERRQIVRALTRGGLPGPPAAIGRVLRALADAGVFRLRAVLVGTLAYQVYGPLLGIRLRSATVMTEDVDVAQFRSVSIAVEDRVPDSVFESLREVDKSFRPVSKTLHEGKPISYQAGGLRVEFLTPMTGADEDEPGLLPALGTSSQPLRFLDYLIYEEIEAVVLHGAGILVRVPDPLRYALHKLILAERRRATPKSRKDLIQAETLIEVLIEDRPDDLRDLWGELVDRGPKWRELAEASLRRLPDPQRNFFIGAEST